MNSTTARIWTFATIILTIVIIALGWFLGVAPYLSQAASANAERSLIEAQNDQTRIAIAELERVSQELPALRRSLEDLRQAFPDQPEYGVTVQDLLDSLAPRGVVLSGLLVGEPVPTDGEAEVADDGTYPAGTLFTVPVSIDVDGSLSSILAFVDAIQEADRFAIVSDVQFSLGSGEQSDSGTGTISVRFFVISGNSSVVTTAPDQPEPGETPTPEATEPAGVELSPEPTPSP